jgi:tetratricopeptide (TPR) repeat protein
MSEPQRNTRISARDTAGLTATILFVGVASLFVIMAVKFPQLYILATYEDLLGEWTQVFFFAATLIGSLFLTRYTHPYRLFFAVLALACFYVVGEEISWGQRLFSFASPEFFQHHNLQQEVNLHNFLTGPTATWQKRIVEIGLVAGLAGYGLIYPLLQRNGNRLAQWLADHGLPVPPLYLSPYFITGALCEVRLFSFNEAEIAELLIAMALAFLTLHYILLNQGEQAPVTPWMPAIAMAGVVLICFSGAGSVSWYCWKSPRLHSQMAKRITAGQKKFAKRYCRYGDWQNAAGLYESLLSKNPEDRGLLRSLARTYKEMEDEQRSLAANDKTIPLDMIHYRWDPRQIAVNLSLFQSLQETGKKDKGLPYLARAMEESHNKVLSEPDNADSFHQCGKCLQAKGDTSADKEQVARAVSMKPASKKYLQAYRGSL